MINTKQPPWLSALILFIAFFSVYLHRAAPTITMGDSGELAAVGSTLGIGHPPGYPLFSLTGKTWTAVCAVATPAFRMNILSGVWCAATLSVICFTLWRLTASAWIATTSALVLGAAPLWSSQAGVCEVFGLNSFFASVLLGLSLEIVYPESTVRFKALYLAFLILGIGLGNHHTLVLLVPSLVAACVSLRERIHRRDSAIALGFLILGLSVYSFVYIRAGRQPVMNWEEPHTVQRLWKLITRARYGTFQLAQGQTPGLSTEGFGQALQYTAAILRENVGAIGLIIFTAGCLALLKKSLWKQAAVVFLAFFSTGPLFFWLTQIHPAGHTRVLLDRFFYLPMIPATLLIGLGLNQLMRFRSNSLNRIVCAIVAGVSIVQGFKVGGDRSNLFVRDLGRDILKSVPPHALLLDDRADESEFSIAYLQRVEGIRPDVQFIDCNAGVSTSIYGPDYYDIWGPPRLSLRTERERSLISSSKAPVFYATHEPKMIPIERYQEGLVYGIPGHSGPPRALPWDELLVFRPQRTDSGLPPVWDRGLHADYLQLLAVDAIGAKKFSTAHFLYRGVFAYQGPSEFRQQMEKYLSYMEQSHAH